MRPHPSALQSDIMICEALPRAPEFFKPSEDGATLCDFICFKIPRGRRGATGAAPPVGLPINPGRRLWM